MLSKVAGSLEFWRFYSIVALFLSLIVSSCSWPRFSLEANRGVSRAGWLCGTIRMVVFEFSQLVFGYLLLFITVQLFAILADGRNSSQMVIVGILCIILVVYTIFCISGRGMEILNRLFIDPGVKSIVIGWKGIHVEIDRTPEQNR